MRLIFTFLVVFNGLWVNAQCAMCRAVLESEAGQNTAKGVNDGIVYLMIIPYVLVSGIAFLVYKKLKKTS
ncbi:MAG: hypothetical protein ACON4B_08360 [Flavobacteriaceae bacterium]